MTGISCRLCVVLLAIQLLACADSAAPPADGRGDGVRDGAGEQPPADAGGERDGPRSDLSDGPGGDAPAAQPGWAKLFSSPQGKPAGRLDTAVDAAGNVYVVGDFRDTLDLGGGALKSAGGRDVFVASLTRGGTLRWSVRLGGSGEDELAKVVYHRNSGTLTVAASFADKIKLGGTELTAAGSGDVFVARIDPASGAVTAAWSVSGPAKLTLSDLALADSGAVAISASFSGGTVTVGTKTYTASGSDGLVVVYDAQGALDWSSAMTGGDVSVSALAFDSGGRVVAGPQFSGSLVLPSKTLTAPSGAVNAALVGFDSAGVVQWVEQLQTDENVVVDAIARDGQSGLVAVGRFDGNATLGGKAAQSLELKPFFLAMDNAGAVRWLRTLGSTSFSKSAGSLDVAVDPSGTAVVLGSFGEASVSFAGTTLTDKGGGVAFIAELDRQGMPSSFAGYSDVAPARVGLHSVAIDQSGGALVIGGSLFGTVDFAGTTLTSKTSGGPDILLLSRVR